MKIVLIEDERLTAEDLKEIITQVKPEAEIAAILSSVKEAVNYFHNNHDIDLIFSDIQLGDGLSFEIFKKTKINIPIIFCTAYDTYAINAFAANGIHYILKPFSENVIQDAFKKYEKLRETFASATDSYLNEIIKLFENKTSPIQTTSVLVHHKDSIIPVKLKDIAFFYIKNEVTHLYTLDKKDYYISKTLDELEQLAGESFYRANRQFIVNRVAIQGASHYFSRKLVLTLVVPFQETITVSKEKTPHFLDWLAR